MILEYIFCYMGVLIAMITDNFWWVSSSPEYDQVKKYSWRGYLNYLFHKRLIPVVTDYRDLIPALYTAFGLSLLMKGLLIGGSLVLFSSLIVTAFFTKYLQQRSWN